MTIDSTRKIAFTAVLFAMAIGLVFVASATRSAVPLFFTWIPLLTVPWILTRPESPAAAPETDGATGSERLATEAGETETPEDEAPLAEEPRPS